MLTSPSCVISRSASLVSEIFRSVVSAWERGESNIPLDLAKVIADTFGIKLEFFFSDRILNAEEIDYSNFSIENVFPDKLRSLMSEKKMDSYMLADKLGISEERLDMYLYQNKQPIAEDLIKLSQYFEVSIDWLLDLDSRKNLSEDEENLLLYYSLMSDKCKKLLTSEAYLLYVKGITGVAAPEYGRYIDSEKKSRPSNGTEGSEAV